MPISPAASMTASVLARPPMLPGLMRSLAAPRRAAWMAMCASKWTSATTGRGEASQTAAKASRQSRRGMAMRTISHPASASRSICARFAATSCAGMLSIDCTATGAPPPTGTAPTITWRVSSFGLAALPMALPSADRSVVAFEGILPCCRAMRGHHHGESAGAPDWVEVRPDREARAHVRGGRPLAAGPPRPGRGRPPHACVCGGHVVQAAARRAPVSPSSRTRSVGCLGWP